MAYNETFYYNCTTGVYYNDANDDCVTSHNNYVDYCGTSHGNYVDYCGTSHDNYVDTCTTSHDNYVDVCDQYYSEYREYCNTYHDNSWGDTYYHNYVNAGCTQVYTDYVDYCGTSHVNAANYCPTSHDNYVDTCNTSHDNYVDYCGTSHNNYADDCFTSQDYTNHLDTSNPSSGDPITLSWSTSNWTGDTMDGLFIQDTMDALKEIRDNIRYLSQNKGQQSVDDTDVSSTSGASQDDEFDDSNSATHETVENEHYEGMRQTIEGLYQALLSSSTGLSTKSDGNMVKKTEWETMKTKTDDLAETSVAYSNVLNYSVGPYTEHTNTVTN